MSHHFDSPTAIADGRLNLCDVYAVVRAFLPDVLRFQPGGPVGYQPGGGNGRGLHDDAFGAALSVFNGSPLGVSDSPHPVAPDFPYLPTAGHDEMPALADVFGLRSQGAESPAE